MTRLMRLGQEGLSSWPQMRIPQVHSRNERMAISTFIGGARKLCWLIRKSQPRRWATFPKRKKRKRSSIARRVHFMLFNLENFLEILRANVVGVQILHSQLVRFIVLFFSLIHLLLGHSIFTCGIRASLLILAFSGLSNGSRSECPPPRFEERKAKFSPFFLSCPL